MAVLAGRVAVITGDSAMSALIARSLARCGAAVAVARGPEPGPTTAAVDDIRSGGGQAVTVTADLTGWDGGDGLIADVAELLGGVHILVLGGGTADSQPLAELTADGWQASMNAQLKGAVGCARPAARRMAAQGEGGAIITVASRSAFIDAPPADAACEAGLMGLTSCLATTLEQYGITANCVLPDETSGDAETGKTAAELVAYLAAPGTGITGQFISCSRGDITVYNRPLAMAGASVLVRNPAGWQSEGLGDVINPLLGIGRY